MVVGGSQQETLNLGFVLLYTHQQGIREILRVLMLPEGLDPIFTVLNKNDNEIDGMSGIFQNKNLNKVNKSWSNIWQNGFIPNPEKIDLNLDITEYPTLKWCLTIANIWSDLFLRRISVFAMSLLGDLIQDNNNNNNNDKIGPLSSCHDNNNHEHEDTHQNINETNIYISTNEYLNEFNQIHGLFQNERENNINHVLNDMNDPYLTWDDMLWIAKNRFTDCVPVLLIGCSLLVNKTMIPSSSTTTAAASSSSSTLLSTNLNQETRIDLNHSNNYFSIDSNKFTDDLEKLSFQCSTNNNNNKDGDHCLISLSSSSSWSSSCSSSSSITTTSNKKYNTKLIYFQTEPNCVHVLDLTKLSNALGDLNTEDSFNNTTTNTTDNHNNSSNNNNHNNNGIIHSKIVNNHHHNHNKQVAYPILKYLDAYISQLGSFLAYHPLLLSAYMALKLTDPILIKNEEIYDQIINDHHINHIQYEWNIIKIKRNQRLQRLHEHFLNLFHEAIDIVAMETTQLNIDLQMNNHNQYINNNNNNTFISQEKIAANSRRIMLTEFLEWSREFDATWHHFQYDIWQQAKMKQNLQLLYHNNNNNNEDYEYKISKGLNGLFNKQLKLNENDLFTILWDAKNEQSFTM
ncbi:unnamed protein product [Schistosoma margrebowiei]|uniref:Uncharacterized protein n=1 Tax=Schistosoma margrebowiei TaxID=48269 RepID=A0A183MGA0_9TREM|nr:unnamed protein product [Schistosoma margrebowiei]